MKTPEPTLRVVPNTPALNTPALTHRKKRVSGLTNRTCKLLLFYMFWFSINYGCSDRCCFHKAIGYEIGDVVDVTVTNCTEVKYYQYFENILL